MKESLSYNIKSIKVKEIGEKSFEKNICCMLAVGCHTMIGSCVTFAIVIRFQMIIEIQEIRNKKLLTN